MLHFAYGSNMSRAVMRRHAPQAQPIGVAALSDYCFVITADGYASVEPKRVDKVYGVLWRLTARDYVTLAAWENIASGLYRVESLPVRQGGYRRAAVTYIARPSKPGPARTGYMELVIAAALEWRLPDAYIVSLRQFLPKRPSGTRPRMFREFGWT